MEEEEILASPSLLASHNTVCTRCPVLAKKIIFYQKKIIWLRRSKIILEDSNQTLLHPNAEAITLHIVEF